MHDNSLSKLEKKIDAVNKHPKKHDESQHHEILTLLSGSDVNLKQVPSLKTVLYGVNRVIYPRMLWENTPELLELLSLSELYRQRIVSNCIEALQWNRFYIKEGASEFVDGKPLRIKDVSLLDNILQKAENPALRETYRNLVLQICSSHIYHLRQSHQTLLIPVFFVRYFPSPEDLGVGDESPHLPIWLRGLTVSELASFRAIRTQVIKALEEVQAWEDEQENRRNGGSFNKFPIVFEWDKLSALLCRHIEKIQKLMVAFESIIANGNKQIQSTKPGLKPEGRGGKSNEMNDEKETESQESKLSYVEIRPDAPRVLPTSLVR